ncbi:MAG TPA: nucleotidyltransferase domain-containing protein [Tepidanaerobacteraceae bacterium]|jgi:predicted nucleotidyltransferase|nr:nucleotidyltransferase domain-containing protein [Tepidanaerobacteraceae bacterium]
MVKIPRTVQKVLENYVLKIDKQIPVKKAILFGSYAKGTYNKDSDIDIAIFSDYFAGMEQVEAFKFLFLQTLDYDLDLQPLAFTVDDYENPKGIVEEIIKTGIEIEIPKAS